MKTTLSTATGALFGLLFFYSFPFAAVHGQTRWVQKKEREHYIEGIYALDVSASMKMVSFESFLEEYEEGQGQALFISFFAPDSIPFSLVVEEQRIINYYRLESKPAYCRKGVNRFGPVYVDDFLAKFVPPSNLGVLLRVEKEGGNYFLPVSVHHAEPADSIGNLWATLRLGKNISGGTYKVYNRHLEGAPAEEWIVQRGVIGRHLAGIPIEIEIESAPLADYSGWVTVQLTMMEKGRPNRLSYKFFFYHAPEN